MGKPSKRRRVTDGGRKYTVLDWEVNPHAAVDVDLTGLAPESWQIIEGRHLEIARTVLATAERLAGRAPSVPVLHPAPAISYGKPEPRALWTVLSIALMVAILLGACALAV